MQSDSASKSCESRLWMALQDDQWNLIKDLLPGKKGAAGRTCKDNRLFVDAVLWLAWTGGHWRELPKQYGSWNSVFQRYNRWLKAGVWQPIFLALSGDPHFKYVMIESTIVHVHRSSAGAKGGLKRRKPLTMEMAS